MGTKSVLTVLIDITVIMIISIFRGEITNEKSKYFIYIDYVNYVRMQ